MTPRNARNSGAVSDRHTRVRVPSRALASASQQIRPGAEWIAHAGFQPRIFPQEQWRSFLGCHTEHHPENIRRVVHALATQGVGAEENPPGIYGIGRVRGRNINRALSAGSLRQHRITSKGVLLRDLLWLDYVLEHSRLLSSPASRHSAPGAALNRPAEPVLWVWIPRRSYRTDPP